MIRTLWVLLCWGFTVQVYADCELQEQEEWQKKVYLHYKEDPTKLLSNAKNCLQNSKSYAKTLTARVEKQYNTLYEVAEEEKETRFYLVKDLLRVVAHWGYAPAQYRYGTLFAEAQANPQYSQHQPDLYTRTYWIKKAAAQSDPHALKGLADIMAHENVMPFVDPDALVPANIYHFLIEEKERLGDKFPFYLSELKYALRRSKPYDFEPSEKFNAKSLAPKEPFTPQQLFIGKLAGSAIRMVLKEQKDNKVEGYYLYDRAYKRWKGTLKIQGSLNDGTANLQVVDKKGKVTEIFKGSYTQHGNAYSFDLTWKSKNSQYDAILNSSSLTDEHLTCEEMINFGSVAFEFVGGDLGTGTYASRNVDYYGCENTIDKAVGLGTVIGAANNIRREGYGGSCSGSISKLHYRTFLYSILQHSFDESVYKSSSRYGHGPSEHLLRWAEQGYFEKQSYQALVSALDKVRPAIQEYYKNKNLTGEELESASQGIEDLIFHWAGTASVPNVPYLMINKDTSLSQLTGFLDKHNANKTELLSRALLNGSSDDLIHYLIDKTDTLNQGKESPLFFAIDSPERIRLLLSNGADIDYQNPFGKTPLYYAIQYNNYDIVQLLIDYGANINHAYKSKKEIDELYSCDYQIRLTQRTPLMHAAQNSDVKMLKLLIDNGANVGQKDEQGNLAIDYAKIEKKQENIEYLSALTSQEDLSVTQSQ